MSVRASLAVSPILGLAIRRAVRRPMRHGLCAGVVLASVAGVPGANAAVFPAELELSTLQTANGGDGTAGFVLNGIDNYDFSGGSVSAAGDVNGDGIDDLIVGAYRANPGGRFFAGESYSDV